MVLVRSLSKIPAAAQAWEALPCEPPILEFPVWARCWKQFFLEDADACTATEVVPQRVHLPSSIDTQPLSKYVADQY